MAGLMAPNAQEEKRGEDAGIGVIIVFYRGICRTIGMLPAEEPPWPEGAAVDTDITIWRI
jgi:hypothetical protein